LEAIYRSLTDVVEAVGPAVAQLIVRPTGFEEYLEACPRGLGSGVIFDERGYILTNHHIVRGSRSVGVVLPDGRSYQGEVLGGDRRCDIALVHIPGGELPVAPLDHSAQPKAGEIAIAIGNALGPEIGPTVSVGVISARARPVREPGGGVINGLLQTDASINPGNSGGPLVTLNGGIVGISTDAIPSRQGVGFAVGAGTARAVFDAVLSSGHVARPWLGIIAIAANPALAANLGLTPKTGALVVQIEDDSSAYFANIQAGDIIVSMDGAPVASSADIQREITHRRVGDKVHLAIWRGGKEMALAVGLKELPLH